MSYATIRSLDGAPDQLFTDLDGRDAAVWLMRGFATAAGPVLTARILRLPWSLVLSEAGDAPLLTALEVQEDPDDPLVRRRGLIQLVDANPSDVPLPRRSLPVFLVNGRNETSPTGLTALTRRLTMLQELGRRSIKQLIVLAGPEAILPPHLDELWAEGLRAPILVVSDATDAATRLQMWSDAASAANVWLIPTPATIFAEQLVQRYLAGRDGRVLLRVRNSKGGLRTVDLTGADDPEHPVLGRYELISEDLLPKLGPDDLQRIEVENFFRNPTDSWRPYAAGVPWPRVPEAWTELRAALRKLDRDGPSSNHVFYIQAESGAGATTFLRSLAWSAAEQGYPTLVAGPAPFTPSGLELVSFLDKIASAPALQTIDDDTRLYQSPALIVFDGHWDGREDQLTRFTREFERSGRRACFLITMGPYLPLALHGNPRFSCLVELTHEISVEEAANLGRHLNTFLRRHGGTRSEAEWRDFFETSAVQADRGIAAFWIALSFWLQRQFDMQETVQAWLYRQFKEKVSDPEVRGAIISIAAFSTERLPLPDAMLPPAKSWPISERLLDLQGHAGALGLVRVRGERERYWALIHDILGRFILTALFYDHEAREASGFGDAQNPEHLRFIALCRLSTLPVLERPDLREIADAFAISIFKINLYKRIMGIDPLGDDFSVIAAGRADAGGVDGVNERFRAARELAAVDVNPDGSTKYRFIGLFDNDEQGRRAFGRGAGLSRRVDGYRDLFLLHPIMPLSNGATAETVKQRTLDLNKKYQHLDWEIEDLVSPEIYRVFDADYPHEIIRTKTIAGKTHRDLTWTGKVKLRESVREYAELDHVLDFILLIRALRNYVRLRMDHLLLPE